MALSAADIDDFLGGPLVTWLASCLDNPDKLTNYESLTDGFLIHEVLVQIDPEPLYTVNPISNPQSTTASLTRIKNFDCIIRNIRALYEEELGQTILQLPDSITLGREVQTKVGLEQLRLLLLLLLGCAVQCPNKEIFIHRIKELPVNTQLDIVKCIKQVTDAQTVVLSSDTSEQDKETLLSHVRSLVRQRDACFQQWTTSQITQMQQQMQEAAPVTSMHGRRTSGSTANNAASGVESNHLAVELADWKARLRKLRQELEEKSESLVECKEELDYSNNVIVKLRAENNELLAEARRAKAYRDELDVLREHSERADRLEAEAQRYRERLADSEFYRQRVEELREDNRVLLDTREMLENQLARARQRSENGPRLEAELLARDQTINELMLERDAAREKIQELVDENTRLQLVTKAATQEKTLIDSDSEADQTNSGDNSLSEQLTNNAQARALKLELENRKLQTLIDNLKESSFHETSDKILEIEKEKKKLSLKCEQLSENCNRVSKQNTELENAFKSALDENGKLQESLDSSRASIDRQSNEVQAERMKSQELERNIEALNKEKQCVQSLCDSIKARADDLDKSLNDATKKIEILQTAADKSNEFEVLCKERLEKISWLEKENSNLQKEVTKLRESEESKNVQLDQQSTVNEQQSKEISHLMKELESTTLQLQKLQEFEQKAQELSSQTAVLNATISTLQKDLIQEKLNSEKLKSIFEKLGLNYIEMLDAELTTDSVIHKMCGNAEMLKSMKEILKERGLAIDACGEEVLKQTEQVVSSVSAEWKQQCEQLCSELESLQGQNARLQVDISTLTSQVNSLTTQHTALQLANSQLVAEKEELIKQLETRNTEHDTLLLDQISLRCLHEQLTSDYEEGVKERETLRTGLRDLRNELRTARESCTAAEKKINALEQEKDALKTESKSLGNLRAEHSKLKDDFRNLFTASERLKSDYRALQENSRGTRAETGRLRLENTALSGEVASAQLEASKLKQRCEMLLTMTVQLDGDRRALMSHAAQLLGQYHALLGHALAGERSHHEEQRALADKVHALCRQKDRLEDKIMEHYRRLDSCTTGKKKGFGASLVRRVRKAGSDFMNKVPGNRRSWQDDSRLTQSEYTLSQTGSGESGNNDSDNSIEDGGTLRRDSNLQRIEDRDNFNEKTSLNDSVIRRSRREPSRRSSLSSTAGSVLSLGSVGTRRTVYLTEQEVEATAPPATNTPEATNNTAGGAGTMLVYNKISTVIGGNNKINQTQALVKPDTEKHVTSDVEAGSEVEKNSNTSTVNKSKENAIWYEYGCV